MSEIEILDDIVGINKEGVRCYPYKIREGEKKGFFSVNLSSGSVGHQAFTEKQLRASIDAGDFTGKGTIRMIPKNTTTGGAGSLSVIYYKNMKL